MLAYLWVYLQSIRIDQARKKRGGVKDFFDSTLGNAFPLLGVHVRSGKMGLKGQKVNLRLISFSRIFSVICVCEPEWCLKAMLIVFLLLLFTWGNSLPSGIFEAVQRMFF